MLNSVVTRFRAAQSVAVRQFVGGGGAPPAVVVAPFRGFYGYRSYVPRVNFSFFYGTPGFLRRLRLRQPVLFVRIPLLLWLPGLRVPGLRLPRLRGLRSRSWLGGYAPYGYGYGGYSGQPYGGLRIDVPQRDAEVYVDGYFVGTVDNFDGASQQANLEAGPHQIEIRSPEFQPIQFSVNIEAGPDDHVSRRDARGAPVHSERRVRLVAPFSLPTTMEDLGQLEILH